MTGNLSKKQRKSRAVHIQMNHEAFVVASKNKTNHVCTHTHTQTNNKKLKTVKNLSAMQETQVWSLDQEDPLEKVNNYPLKHSCLENSIDRGIYIHAQLYFWASLVTQNVKNPPATHETQVLSLGQEDPLQKGVATHSSIPSWRIPWTEEPGGLQSMGLQRVRNDWVTNNDSSLRGLKLEV